MLTLLINESKPLDGLFANATTGGIGSVPDISVADDGQAVSVQTFTRTAGVIADSFVAGDVLHIGIGDGVNTPVCYIALASASTATGTMPINTVGMVALFAATVANQLSLQVGVVRTRGAYTNTIFSAPIVIHRSVIDPDTAVPTPSILGTGVYAALQVAINTALGFVRLDASARLPAVDGSQLINMPSSVSDGDKGEITVSNSGATWTIDNDTVTLAKLAHMTTARVVGRTTAGTGTPELLTISGTGSVAMTTSPSFTTPALDTPSAIVLTNASGTASININGTVGATTPSTVAGTTGTFSGAVTGTTFNAVPLNRGLGDAPRNIALGDFALAVSTTGNRDTAIGRSAMASVTIGDDNVAVGSTALFNNISGNQNTAVGSQSLQAATGSGNVALGYYAGSYETGSNSLYIDNRDRTDTAGDKAKALLYGTFAATAAAQQLTINAGTVTLNGSAVTAASYAGAGTGLTGTAASLTAGNVTTNANLTGHVTSTGNAAVLGSFTMAQLSTAVSDGDPAYVGAANTFTGTTNTFTLPTTTGTTTASGIAVAGNSLTTGTGLYAASSTLTSGKLLDLQVSGTAAAASQTVLNIATAGANGTSTITTKGAVISNTHTGTTSTNIALELNASGGTTNTALNVANGGIDVSGVSTFRSNIFGVGGSAASFSFFSDVSNNTSYFQTNADSTHSWTLLNRAAASGRVLLSVQGAASQSADLQQWQNSSATVLAKVDSAGNLSTTGTLTVTGATTLSAALITTPESLAPALNAGAACGVTTVASGFALNGVNALTLANGTNGQIKTIVCTAVTAAGTATLTPTTCSGFTTVAFTAAGQTLTLQYFTTGGWVILSVRGATPA